MTGCKQRQQIVITITNELYEELNTVIRNIGLEKSYVYEDRMKYGIGCAKLDCVYFNQLYSDCKESLKGNKNVTKVCLHISNKAHSSLKDVSENRSMSCVCFASMLVNVKCPHLCEEGVCERAQE